MEDVLGLMEESDEKKAIEVRVTTVLDEAKGKQIRVDREYELMGEFLLKIKGARKDLDSYWDPEIKKANETTKGLRAKKKEQSEPLDLAEGIAKQKMKVYHLAEEEKKRKAEAERRAEQERLQAEAEKKARAEQARKQAEEEARAEAEGREDVKTVEYEAPVVSDIVPEVAQETPQVSGISYVEKWRWECTDFSKVSDNLKKLDDVKINGLVTHLKGDFNYEGIRAYPDKVVKARV